VTDCFLEQPESIRLSERNKEMRISRKRKEENLRRLLIAATMVFLLSAGGLAADTWHALTHTLVATKSGAAIVLGRPDSLYAMFGGNSTAFQCYRPPPTDNWFSFPQQLPFQSGVGGALVADTFASCIYALRGGTTGHAKEVWQYNIAVNSWSRIADLPVPVSEGAALAFERRNGVPFVYAIVGGQSSSVYRYGPYGPGGGGSGIQPQGTTYNWYQVASLHTSGGAALHAWPGACLAAANDSIFCIPCDPNVAQAFVAYSPATNNWYSSTSFSDVSPGPGCAVAGMKAGNGERWLWCLVGHQSVGSLDFVRQRTWDGLNLNWAEHARTWTTQNMGASITWGIGDWAYAFFGDSSTFFKRSWYH
jgi:hypothetical protein